MPEQKVLYLEKKQGSYVVSTREIEKPQPGELVVKIQAAALNPADWKIQAYDIFVKEYPAILGTDIAGDVEAVGEGVEGFAKGDRVFFQGFFSNEFAGFQQYTRVPAEIAAKIPTKYSHSQAASLPLGFATAAIGLFSEIPKGLGLNPTFDKNVQHKGQAALVIGGSSSVGQYALQVLKFAGFSTIVAYASGHHTNLLKTLGATHVVDRKAVPIADLPAAAQKVTNAPFPIVYDAISEPDTQIAAYAALADNGKLLLTLPSSLKDTVESKKVVAVYGNVHPESNRAFGKIIYKHFTSWLEDGTFVPNNVEELPNGLAGIPDGLERMKNNQVSGVKLIGKPQETA
ncbi:GroES-like protein [Moniliophthora roreri MCA 2997]|uniref:GroES-like protein n=1 Tax=Moniliophthora roreri (strain MCA 2997) TaxID=1381753 RepID=V2XJ38_MONRO|nr:GroES-like protein [Moniliophthora roreri MCA 2997]KAI3607818.1 GroES-like protein [Moniliophthora roreri]